MSNKPTVFIASSSEAISVAEAVHIKLEQELRVRLWENAFDLSSVTITTLIDKTKEADYSVFVFHPDDKSIIRNTEYSAVRDNVVLELGMFIARIIHKKRRTLLNPLI
ncbi:TIR domain-containing protein [Marinobacter metalliresistant]|uniref:Nucleotide-binding protein n=1 Tax=Marinobacter metalliresistant TaxID=2961995 RepID=A0ABZ2VX73_9GAMM